MLAPIFSAASPPRLATCNECWKVPGQLVDSFLNRGLLMSDSSMRVIDEVKPKAFSTMGMIRKANERMTQLMRK